MSQAAERRTLVAGVDSSTQACKVVIRDAETGELIRTGRASHPDGTEVDPTSWSRALDAAVASAGGLADVAALSVAAQQHGMVCLDDDGVVVRPALLWNDTRSAPDAAELVAELGDGRSDRGARAWADAVGSVPVASFTVAKVRWLAAHEPASMRRAAAVCLPHDWLTWQIGGTGDITALRTDRGDASGTGYWSPATGDYRLDLLHRAGGKDLVVPAVLGPADSAGSSATSPIAAASPVAAASQARTAYHSSAIPSAAIPPGIALGAGTGDNAAAALGVGAGPGDVVVSIGTSGTVFGVARNPTADPTGIIAGFADASGLFLPLVCTLNAARVLSAAAAMLGVSVDALNTLAMSAAPGAGGVTMVPYLDGERTPNRPDATGSLHGLTVANATPNNLARAAIEGMLCGLADGLDALRDTGMAVRRVLLIGGGARSEAVRAIAPAIFGAPVAVPEPGEYVADGAARQAAWMLSGAVQPPAWTPAGLVTYEADPRPDIRARYGAVRDLIG